MKRNRLYEYNIDNFIYDSGSSTLIVNEEDLYHYERKHHYIFPNKGKKFYIRNPKTLGFRRFKLIRETKDFYLFAADDVKLIRCLVKKMIFKW